MKRAAIVTYGYDSNRIMFWVLGKPCELGRIIIELGDEDYELLIFEVPYAKESKYKIKQKRIIERFCGENNIQCAVYADDEDDKIDNFWYVVKLLCVLREIEAINKEAIFSKSFGIVSNTLNQLLLDAISEEASSITILKTGQDQADMEKLHKKIMEEKGLSVVYADDISALISQSRVVLWETSSPMTPHISLEKVFILPKCEMENEALLLKYEQQIGKAVIKLSYDEDVFKIASYFPFVHFIDTQGNPMKKDQVRRAIARSNKILTIQKG